VAPGSSTEILARVRTDRPKVYFRALVKLTLVLHRALGKPHDFDRRRNREEVLDRLGFSASAAGRE
jgi:hypothetical protein